MALEDHLLTEARNPDSEAIDTLAPREIVALMNAEDAKVVEAVRAESESIAQAIEWAAERFRRGGRLIYVGAGTSGRLGVLDASECPPTFSTPPEMVVGLIAGGPAALTRAIEGAEDDPDRGADGPRGHRRERATTWWSASPPRAARRTSSGRSARPGRRGAATVGITCNRPSLLGARGRPGDRPAGRPGGHRRLDPAQGGDRDQDDLEHDHDRGDGPDRQDAGEPDDRPEADQREAPDPEPPDAPRACRDRTTTRRPRLLARCEGRLKRALVVALRGR